jgi:cytochrome c biogenesis protein CcmG, thiol:disulfide interchange protein DsbE
MRLVLASLVFAASGAAAALEVSAPAPDLALQRLDEPAQSLALASLKGSVVYVDFWASWCVPCRVSMPALDAMYRRNRSRGFAVVGVNKDVSSADAQRFLKRVGVSFPLVQDAQDAAARAFDVKAMPSGYLLDRKGIVRNVHRGFTDATAAALQREIETLLQEPS